MSTSFGILGLLLGLVLLFVFILKTKIHVFLALIISASIIGLTNGVAPGEVVEHIQVGFGTTLGNIGIIIGFGVMMGQIFEMSGAAERMAKTFTKMLGKGREEIAMALTGFIVSIPIFCDSGFVVLSPLAKAISRKIKKSVISLGIALALGLVITHSLVPPTPGPVGVAAIFGVGIGSILLWGLILAVPMTAAGMVYGSWVGKKIYQLPGDKEGEWIRPQFQQPDYGNLDMDDNKTLPSFFMSILPILVPIVLILVNTTMTAYADINELENFVHPMIEFLGAPVIAVAIGLLIAIFGLAKGFTREVTLENMEEGIKSAGIIILVTGGGGALGRIIGESGLGEEIALWLAGIGIPGILVPFAIASMVRLIQGSGTVAMLTAASITAPMVDSLGVDPVFAALAACVGSLVFSYFNDSYFWVVNRTLGIKDVKEQIRVWSVTTTIAWAVGFVCLLVLNGIFG
ncbi:GntP family permease [Proteinivorax tanatarense]|uniref:GntP family permease n=1 Tax=Proteinivorax tanatarense TaxID=1260629 RepID=A0AAU7VM87_9FIRM